MANFMASVRSFASKVPRAVNSASFPRVRRRLSGSAVGNNGGAVNLGGNGGSIGSTPGYGVWMWGIGSSGQLGFPMESGALSNFQELLPRPLDGFDSAGVRTMACGMDHTALVTTDGRLLTWGSDKNGKLGLGDQGGRKVGQQEKTPVEVEGLKGVDVVSVSCGDNHTVAVDKEGVAYSWGWGGSYWSGGGALGLGSTKDVSVPTKITELSDQGAKVDQVYVGQNHSVFLTTDGEVWTCGAGEYGRCGNGGTGDQLVPAPLEAFENHVIVEIKAGHAFTLALTSEGEVFGWGRNDAGQLGLGGGLTMDVYAMESDPISIEQLADEKVVSLGAGHNHSAAVTEDGKLFMWGMKRALEPEWMSVLEGKRVVLAGCGEKFTVAVTDEGELYTFGRGASCCLGHGKKNTLAQPALVEALRHTRVRHVACGHKHIAALVAPLY